MSMTSQELRAMQTPLKSKYKMHPSTALITHHAKGKLGDRVNCIVNTQHGEVNAGLHSAAGGDGSHICSGDLLLEALVACAGVTLNAVATNMNIELLEAIISAEGEIDFRGTLGVSREVPVGFKTIRLIFQLQTSSPREQIDKLLQLTERYCVVYQTLKQVNEIVISHSLQ